MSTDQYVNLLCRSVWLELRGIGHLRRHLLGDATKSLVSSFVLSRLDYCNSLLAGVPENRLDRLQRVENNAARPVLGRRGRDHSKPLLRSLHWLSIEARIEYKISILCHVSRYLSSPSYVSHLLAVYQPSHSLHSTDALHGLMNVPRFNLNKCQKRAVSNISLGPVTWNSISIPNTMYFQSENVPFQKASVVRTFTVRPTRVSASLLFPACLMLYYVPRVYESFSVNLLFYFYRLNWVSEKNQKMPSWTSCWQRLLFSGVVLSFQRMILIMLASLLPFHVA